METERNLKTDKKTIASVPSATVPTENVISKDNKARAIETPVTCNRKLLSSDCR